MSLLLSILSALLLLPPTPGSGMTSHGENSACLSNSPAFPAITYNYATAATPDTTPLPSHHKTTHPYTYTTPITRPTSNTPNPPQTTYLWAITILALPTKRRPPLNPHYHSHAYNTTDHPTPRTPSTRSYHNYDGHYARKLSRHPQGSVGVPPASTTADTETGLYYYGYRYYDPVTGRWPSRDPLGGNWTTGEFNEYAFILNSPIYWIDILGEKKGGAKPHPAEGPGGPTGNPKLPDVKLPNNGVGANKGRGNAGGAGIAAAAGELAKAGSRAEQRNAITEGIKLCEEMKKESGASLLCNCCVIEVLVTEQLYPRSYFWKATFHKGTTCTGLKTRGVGLWSVDTRSSDLTKPAPEGLGKTRLHPDGTLTSIDNPEKIHNKTYRIKSFDHSL